MFLQSKNQELKAVIPEADDEVIFPLYFNQD